MSSMINNNLYILTVLYYIQAISRFFLYELLFFPFPMLHYTAGVQVQILLTTKYSIKR